MMIVHVLLGIAVLLCSSMALSGVTPVGLDLSVGPGEGIVSCGADSVDLRSEIVSPEISRLTVSFKKFQLDVDHSHPSQRAACVVRLRETRDPNTKLIIYAARVFGNGVIANELFSHMGLIVESLGQKRIYQNRDLSHIDGEFIWNIPDIEEASPLLCRREVQSELFAINLTSAMSGLSNEHRGQLRVTRIELDLEQVPCGPN